MLRPAPLSSVLNEEVSLEGLEGATLNTLWNRLAIRLKMTLPLPQPFCDSVWSLVVRQREYSFFELPAPRKPFEFFDRMQHVDPGTGVMKEPKEYPGHRFRYEPILAEGVRGSCECYETRVPVDRELLMGMGWQDVEAKWPFQFVVMASQKMRESFIVDSNFTLDFTIIQYCMLEWIARARFNGETSQGKYSLLEMTKDSSILYYNRKFLTDNRLITRQALCQRTGESSIQGMVFHLPRYYNEMKPKNLMITEKVVNILKQRPNYQADYEEIKQIVLGRSEARKWFRCPEFAKYVRSDETVPYRMLYPDADEREWKMKNRKCEEKQIRVMRLIDPEADVYDLWYKDEVPEEDQKDGMLNSQKAYIDMPVLQQAYNIVAASAESGVSQSAMALQMGLDKLNSRAVVKNLLKLKAIEGHAVDEGRQRTTKYFIPGITQPAVSFDKEIQLIQLMNNQIEQQQQLQSEPQMIVPDEAFPGTSSTPLTAIVKAESGGSFSITMEQDDDDEQDEDGSFSASNTTLANTEALDAIQCEISISDQVVSLKKAQGGISGMMKSKHLSAKLLRRCNQVVDMVKEFQVLEPRTILKKINEHEKSLGNKSEACNKSILRLLGKLAADKFLKIANVRLVKEDRELSVIYACENSVDENSKVLQSKIDSAKTRMLLQNPGSVAMVSKKLATAEEADDSIVPKTGYSYEGTLAKCLRMKLFHEYLFYLIYTHPEDAPVLTAKDWSRLPGIDDFNETISPIYSTDGWKIFVPPLSSYEGYGEGWAVITDITIRLPLSIFCQICTFGFYTKELDYYLNHPLRRHMLIKQLPRPIRLQLLRQRKYVYNIYELCAKLCYAGLLQFGPQRAKDRDQTYIYLNRRTALLDTRSSEIGYNEIEDKEYPMHGFQFFAPEDLGRYWETLYSFAMETILNRRSVAIGKEILVQQLALKPEMIEAIRPRSSEQTIANDVQKLPPGDARGAAGMDTAMFIHLKSNWHKIMNYAPAERANQKAKIKHMKTVKKMIAINKEKAEEAATTGPIAALNTKRLTAPKEPSDKKLLLKSKLTVKPFAKTIRKYGERKNAVRIRKIESRVSKARARNIYDEVDRRALKLMKKLRVDWNRHEDAILLLCRIGVHYLFGEQNLKQNNILTSSIYRDILHWTDPVSQNKTSRACQRRVNYMVKHKHGNASSIKLCVEEAKLNPVVERRFGADFLQNLRETYPGNEEFAMALKVHFVELVYLLKRTLTKLNSDHFRGVAEEDTSDRLIIPNTIPEFEKRFNVLQMQDKVDGLNYDRNPKCLEDIILFKLITLIHSAVTNVKDRSNLNVQLFNVYKNYAEKHLSMAMKMVRSFKMISLTRKLKAAKVVPASIVNPYNPYRVSVSYLNQLCTKIPFEIFGLVYEHYMRLVDRASFEDAVTFDDGGQGLMLLLAELIAIDRAEMQLEAPAQYIQVSPELQNTSKADELCKLFNEFPVGDEDKGTAPDSEPEVPEIKPEPDPKKLRFNSCTDVCFNYVTHPIERLTKIPMEYLHFFCLLNSFRERSYLRNYKIDQTANICAMPDCILLDADRGLITKCIAIALARRETIERLKMSKVSRIEMTPALSLREDNLMQFFTRSINEYVKTRTDLQRRDLGKIVDGLKKQINMVELADEIVRFDKAQDFNWLDRYEITQAEDYEGRDDEGDDSNVFSRNLPTRDEVTEKVYKMHNFYVVTYLKINVRLLYEHPNELQQRVEFDHRSIPRVFLPENYELRQDILTKITSDAIWPPQEELEPLLEQASPLIYKNPRLSALASFIEDREHFGASVQELADRFRNRDELRSDLQMLINFKFILRTGFRHVVYVHWQYVQPWLVKTSCVVHDSEPDSSSSAGERPLKRRRSEDEVEPPPRKARRQEVERRLEEAVERDRFKPKKNLSLSMHPWHKVDGAINHRLLYRWLTSLLMYCISHPGVLLTLIYSRFNLMAPVHLYNLLEILQEYGCIKLFVMDVRSKRTLFSTFRPVKIEPATEFDREEHTYIEPCPSALSTLSMFIGDHRKFQEDFLTPSKTIQDIAEEEEEEEEDVEEQINTEDTDKE